MSAQNTIGMHVPTLQAYLQKLRSAQGNAQAVEVMANGRSETQIRDAAQKAIDAYADAKASVGGTSAKLFAKLDEANFRKGDNGVLDHGKIFDGDELEQLKSDAPLLELLNAVSNLHTTYFGSGTADLGFESRPLTGHAPPVEYHPEFSANGGPRNVWD
jgi:hypothetical protein